MTTTPTPVPISLVPPAPDIADAYFAATSKNDPWIAIDPARRQQLLNEAAILLNTICFDQSRDCCGRSFVDYWTMAVCELALTINNDPSGVFGAVQQNVGRIKKQKLGDLEQEFYDAAITGTNDTKRFGPHAPMALQRYPWLYDLIGCWITSQLGNTRVIARVRS